MITAAAIYARVFFFLYVYIISVFSLKDLIIISVVITVDVKVYIEAMLINTIYLYLIFRLLDFSLLYFAYSNFSRLLNDHSRPFPTLARISVHVGVTLTDAPNAVKGYRNIYIYIYFFFF